MQHAAVTDLLSPVVDERIERFMTLPPSYVDIEDDDKKPSPRPGWCLANRRRVVRRCGLFQTLRHDGLDLCDAAGAGG